MLLLLVALLLLFPLDEPPDVEVCGERAWSLESEKLFVDKEMRVVVGVVEDDKEEGVAS